MQAESEPDDSSSEVHAIFKTPLSAKRRKCSASTSSSSVSTPPDPDLIHSALKQASDTLKNINSPIVKDELDHYGAMVACQLRGLTEEQRSMAMLRFSQLIHDIKFSQPPTHNYNSATPNSMPSHSSIDNCYSQPDHTSHFISNSAMSTPHSNPSHSPTNPYSLRDYMLNFNPGYGK